MTKTITYYDSKNEIMDEPEIRKYPTELFGHPYSEYEQNEGSSRKDFKNQHCPYLNAKCTKSRKSNKEIKIGTCSLGMHDKHLKKWIPNIICPQRLLDDKIFKDLKNIIFPKNRNIRRIQEVSIGDGKIDYVFVKCGKNKKVNDFCCVEFQTGDTTGSVWDAIIHMKKSWKYEKNNYKYGFNWAHQYQKTMMQQILKKGLIIEKWKKHLLIYFQDVGMRYLSNSPSSDINELKLNKSMKITSNKYYIHFVIFKMEWKRTKWVPTIDKLYDTTASNIINLLGAPKNKNKKTVSKFIDHIQDKLNDSTHIR